MEILFRKLNGEFALCVHAQLKCDSKFEFDTNERKPRNEITTAAAASNNKNFAPANFDVEFKF